MPTGHPLPTITALATAALLAIACSSDSASPPSNADNSDNGFGINADTGDNGDAGQALNDDSGQSSQADTSFGVDLDADDHDTDSNTAIDTGSGESTTDVSDDADQALEEDSGPSENDAGAVNDTGDDADPQCTLDSPASLSCQSGYDELDDGGLIDLMPDDMEAAGCQFQTDHDSFQSFESMTWTIQGCPGELHRFRLKLNHCSNKAYPSHLTIEPVHPECDLNDHAEMRFSPADDGPIDMSCEALERAQYCYLEKPHDEGGGSDWTMLTRSESGQGFPPWYIILDVEFDWDAHFEYRVTAEVPPL